MNRSRKITSIILAAFAVLLSNCGAISGENFTLNIFGNANMDGAIDERDVAFVEGVVKGTNAATSLCDANYDGTIDGNDAAQIEQIIRGVEKKLTLIDRANRTVTMKMPVERFVPLSHRSPQVFLALGARDKIVAIDSLADASMPEFHLKGLPEVSRHGKDLDYEKILELNTDLVVMTTSDQAEENAKKLPNFSPCIAPLYGVEVRYAPHCSNCQCLAGCV
jgi:iron complex transport system substrate-binding protein